MYIAILRIGISYAQTNLQQKTVQPIRIFHIDTIGSKLIDNLYDDYLLALEVNGKFSLSLPAYPFAFHFRMDNCANPVRLKYRITDVSIVGKKKRRKNQPNWFDGEIVIDTEVIGTYNVWLHQQVVDDSAFLQVRAVPYVSKKFSRKIAKSKAGWIYDCSTQKPRLEDKKGNPVIIYNPPKTLSEIEN